MLSASWFGTGAAFAANISVDRGVRHQTISGWEATAYAGQDSPSFPAYRDALLRMAAEDLGLTRIRIEVRASSEHARDLYQEWQSGAIDQATWRASRYSTVNDNADPNVINQGGFHFTELDYQIDQLVVPFRREVARAGATLHVNLCYVAFTSQNGSGTSYLHDNADEYAEFVAATYTHLQTKYGWVPDTWEVLLEPDLVGQWNGTKMGQAIVTAAARVRALGHSPRFIAPSTTNMANAPTWFDALAAVPGATSVLAELSYHRYQGASVSAAQAIATRTSANRIGSSMLELIGADHNTLHEDLTVGNAVAWAQFTFGGPGGTDDGGGYFRVDASNPSMPGISYGSRTRYLRQYMKYVRPGAVRVTATATDGVQAVAFENTGGRYAVVAKANASAPLTVTGLPDGAYGITYTTASAFGASLPDVTVTAGSSVSATLPAAGVITFFARAAGVDGGAPDGSGGASGSPGDAAADGGAAPGGAGGTAGTPATDGGPAGSSGNGGTSSGASGAGGVAATSGRSTGGAAPNAASGSDDNGGCGCRTASRAGTSDVLPQLLGFLFCLYLARKRKRAGDFQRAEKRGRRVASSAQGVQGLPWARPERGWNQYTRSDQTVHPRPPRALATRSVSAVGAAARGRHRAHYPPDLAVAVHPRAMETR